MRVLTGLLSLPLCVLAGCHHGEDDQSVQAAPIAPIAVVERAPLTNTLEVAGEFLPFQEVELHAKVAGYIRRINVDIGDKVKTGQVLATLDIPELSAQVEGASAGVRRTQDEIARAKSDIARAEANYQALHSAAQRLKQVSDQRPGLIAQQELDDAMAKDSEAAAQVDEAKSALSATEQQLGVSVASRQEYQAMADYSRITAPFSGVVTWRYADTGALIQAGTTNAGSMPVVKLAEVNVLRLRLPVPESLAGAVKVGDVAMVRVQAVGDVFTGKVTRTTGALDPSTRTMQVEIDVPNKNGRLTPGMYADVTLKIERSGDSLVVPVQAVDLTGASPVVMLVDGENKVRRRVVEVGISTANRTEIVGGLKEGDKVIVANLATFQPGETVTPKVSAMTAAQTGGSKANGEAQ
jgi:RND family efflux transporter MFP subunit